MGDSSKNKFTLKIVLSYVVLAILALGVGYFIFSEIKGYLSSESSDSNDIKLLKTSSLLTQLYEAESLSKLAIQTRTTTNFKAYSTKIDSISTEIDSLKLLIGSAQQQSLLDSVQILLKQKVDNSSQLRKLKVQNEANNSLDRALEEFKKMEASLGKITPEALAPNINELSPKAQMVIRDLATYLNNNVPKDGNEAPDTKEIDSILNTSKTLLNQAKLEDSRTQRSLERKEFEIHSNELVLSRKLRSIIAAFEQEVIVNTYNDNLKKQAMFRRSIRLSGFAALLGFVIVGIFTFLINKDFWKVQTYRQQIEKEKKFSESLLKSREQLIATVSHDLRTPLNTISGYAELIENTPLTYKQLSYLGNIKSASQYVESLVNDLLDYSKLEAGKIKIDKIPFVLSELIIETAENLKEIYKEKPVELTFNIDKRLDAIVIGDPFRIRQILTNLVSNAYKFTHKGKIEVVADIKKATSEQYLTSITVKDSGIGIPKEKQKLIFKEFTQADENTESKYGGYGLGLTISRKLTKLLNGTIKLKSEEGKGSTFAVTIPLQIPHTPVKAVLEKNIPSKNSAFALLIIDDDASMLQLLSELCANMGIRVHGYQDFGQLDKKENITYNAVITDIQMPVTDGFGVIKKLQSGNYEHYTQQPVIAMTGRRDLEISSYYNAGFREILQKPFGKDAFFEVLSHIAPEQFCVKKNIKAPKKQRFNQILYDLSLISSFLGENEDAIFEVITTFIAETKLNIHQLRLAVENKNFTAINNISHRMLPMFRQLKVASIIPDLEFLELVKQEESQINETLVRLSNIEKYTAWLLEALSHEVIKSPSCID
ncbi:MAG: response regulator [Eudoraea sp.]|nr:response regulator [Eudoraea sp.]